MFLNVPFLIMFVLNFCLYYGKRNLNFCVPCLIATFILAKSGIRYFLLQVLIKLIFSCIFVYLSIRSSNFLLTQIIFYPCFFLICRNILTQAYSFIINKITRSLNIFCKENKRFKYFPFTVCLAFALQSPSWEWQISLIIQ